ncbi:MAG: SCO family protein [Thermoleophilaceae bacterium]|nr:SCO family protein [Thermoleophilaceae bacterium]
MHPRVLIALVAAGALALAAAAVIAARDEPREAPGALRFEGSSLPKGLRAPELGAVRTQDGERLTMRSLRGRPVIVTFLYTTCDDTCPTQAQQVKGALNDLGRRVPAIAIAVDPQRDTPTRARAFLARQRMTGRMDFVLGSRRELTRLWNAYSVRPQREDLEHTARLVLVDPKGTQRVSFPLDQLTPERLAHDLRLLADGH